MRERKWKIAPYGGCPGKLKIMEQDRLTRLSWMKYYALMEALRSSLIDGSASL